MERARSRRRWWAAAAFGAVAAGTAAAYVYQWWYQKQESELEEQSANGASSPAEEDSEAGKNLQSHYSSIQRISDTTTLPQMLEELERGLNRTANVDLLIVQLREPSSGRRSRSKLELWEELKVTSWARTLSIAWLVALADLLLRVQLNILGRYIFLQTHLTHPSLSSWQSPTPAARITGRAQELFIEYAHYLPERACDSIVGCMRSLVEAQLGDADLGSAMDASTVLRHTSAIFSTFEAWALEKGWARLMLPSKEEAAQYFAGFHRQAPPDTTALGPGYLESDDEVIHVMVQELHAVMDSARFSSAVLAAVRQGAELIAERVAGDIGDSSLPLAKLLSKITAAGNALLNVRTGEGQRWLRSVAELPQVDELCASLYSCKPSG